MPDSTNDERILGDMRIFQSVFNDLNMSHEMVTDSKGVTRYAYVYDGIDPYQLEDSSFKGTVALIHQHTEQTVREARKSERALIAASLKKWVNSRLANYGRNDTINALQERIAQLTTNPKGGDIER